MKFGQLTECTRETFSSKITQEAERLVPDLFFFLKKALYVEKASDP